MSRFTGKLETSTLARAGLMAMLALAVGCSQPRIGGSQPPDEVIDELRDENQALKDEIAKLQRNIELRLAEIDTLNQQASADGPDAQGRRAASPLQMQTLALDRFTGLVDSDGDGRADVIRAYVQPRDGQDRFLPVKATATMQAVILQPQREPVVLAQRVWDAAAWDDAYRSGFTGSHYTLELPLDEPLAADAGPVTLVIAVTDASHGVQKTIRQTLGNPSRAE